jgi:non-heme chloroperoxidase
MPADVPRLRFAATRLVTGPELHYAEQGDPGGEAIVFLPAYADSWFWYSRVLPLLPTRYHAYALDQRGHGDAERPACCYTVDDFAADAVAFLDATGIQRATLVGHSGSCFVARRVAVTHPERVARLVLSGSPAGSLPEQVAVGLQATVRALADPVPADFVRRFQAGAAVGDRDGLLPSEDQRRLAAAIPGARSRVYPETGHSPHWERPQRFAADLDAFMREG